MGNIVENIKCSSFQDFFDKVLNPSGDIYNKIGGWIFRGHADADWKLKPTALRDDFFEKDLCKQINKEYNELHKFYYRANKLGINLPYCKDLIVPQIKTTFPNFDWPFNNLLEVLSLAQHYSVPTRLLDWTSDVYVAMFFSIFWDRKKQEDKEPSDLAIWCFNPNVIFKNNIFSNVHLIYPRYHLNPNAFAQKGILSVVERKIGEVGNMYEFCDLGNLYTLKDNISFDEFINFFLNENEKETFFYKITLPRKEVEKMYEFLHRVNKTASNLFPGYEGIKRELKDDKNIKTY